MSSPIPIYDPGTHHHARWTAKIIYAIKIALLRDQLLWLRSTNATDALQLDLDLPKLMYEAKTKVGDPGTIKMVEADYVKLKNHLWYLSGRFVPLALFSTRIADRDKKEMANAIVQYQN